MLKDQNDSDDEDSDSDSDNDDGDQRGNDFMRRAREIDKNRKRNYDKLVAEKEKKRLLYLKRQITKAPKKPKLLNFEVSFNSFWKKNKKL